jgi:transposase InsO family protein
LAAAEALAASEGGPVTERSAQAMADFLEHDIVPAYQQAGIKLVEVITDGPEFTGGAFRRRCAKLGIRRHKLPPRSPNPNAFVNASRPACFTCTTAPRSATVSTPQTPTSDADLQAWLRCYNFETPPPRLPHPRPRRDLPPGSTRPAHRERTEPR